MIALEPGLHGHSTPPVAGDALAPVRAAARAYHEAHPEVAGFAPWPDDLHPGGLPPREVPAAHLVAGLQAKSAPLAHALVEAIRDAALSAHWQRLYSEAEVGADFRARFAFFNLYGATGHYHSDTAYGSIAYWDPGLHYDWHLHPAEELYVVLAGEAEFHVAGAPSRRLGPGQTQFHASNQPHALTTHDQPLLAYVIWRGAGIGTLPRMGQS